MLGYEIRKKWMACLLAVIMTFSLTACGVSGDQIAVNKPQHKDPDAKNELPCRCRRRICSVGRRTAVT